MKTDRDLNKLDKDFKHLVEQLIKKSKFNGWKMFVTEGYRSEERQNWLYAQGRTRSGEIVTYLKGKNSSHYIGRAVDVAFKNWYGRVSYSYSFFKQANKIASELGIKWGGNWKRFIDYPHFYVDEIDYKAELKKYESKDIKTAYESFVYKVEDGKKRFYQDEVVYSSNGRFFLRDLEVISVALMQKIPRGKDMTLLKDTNEALITKQLTGLFANNPDRGRILNDQHYK